MKLHLIGLFHTLCNQSYSHCAFTGKVFRFAKMMEKRGYEVIEYANDSESECKQKVNILTSTELQSFVGDRDPSAFHGDIAKVGSPLWKEFSNRLWTELTSRFNSASDIVCHPFGAAHEDLKTLGGYHVETGIGYPHTFSDYRIFESYAWLHYHAGKANRGGNNYEWVAPNYFDSAEWNPSFSPGSYLLYFGRIADCKGLNTIVEISKHTKHLVVLCGQGDPTPYLSPNIHYIPPICGPQRSELLRNAIATLMPTKFIEPFGGSGVEGLLCGTPLISSDYGAFSETVQPGLNGYRCHTLGDWIEAIHKVQFLDRQRTASDARQTYDLNVVGKKYDSIFNQINDLRKEGWYTPTPRNV